MTVRGAPMQCVQTWSSAVRHAVSWLTAGKRGERLCCRPTPMPCRRQLREGRARLAPPTRMVMIMPGLSGRTHLPSPSHRTTRMSARWVTCAALSAADPHSYHRKSTPPTAPARRRFVLGCTWASVRASPAAPRMKRSLPRWIDGAPRSHVASHASALRPTGMPLLLPLVSAG